jgi:hypothetical protein
MSCLAEVGSMRNHDVVRKMGLMLMDAMKDCNAVSWRMMMMTELGHIRI